MNKKNITKVIAGLLSLVIIIKIVPFADVFAQGRNIEFDFTDGTINGNVITYTVGEVDVTATLDNNYTIENGVATIDDEEFLTAFTITNYNAETMQIKVYGENNFNLKYNYNDGTLTQIDDGGLPDNVKFVIEQKTVNPPPPGPGDEPGQGFDGRAVVLWSCGNNDSKVCYHEFSVVDPDHCDFEQNPNSEACAPEIGNFDDGNSTFFRASEIEADNRQGTTFNVDAKYREWYTTDRFYEWLELYEIATGHEVDWNTLDPELIMGAPNQHIGELVEAATSMCGPEPDEYASGDDRDAHNTCIEHYAAEVQHEIWTHELQPVGEPTEKNAYVSYGDRNFKVVIFNDDYRGVSTGNLEGLTYYPAHWADPFLRTDQYDISETTEAKPKMLESILLESTVNINAIGYNGFEISSITPLDVPAGAVTVTKNADTFSIVFSSHFYDNVVFKIVDSHNEEYYIQIKRYTVDGYIGYTDNHPALFADFYYKNTDSYEDFNITAKILYKDGTTKTVTLEAQQDVDDGLGNFSHNYYIDQEYPDENMDKEHDPPIGKGLYLSRFRFDLEQDEDRNIQDVYLNAEYKGSTASNYAGAYSGSGEGTLANIYHPEEEE